MEAEAGGGGTRRAGNGARNQKPEEAGRASGGSAVLLTPWLQPAVPRLDFRLLEPRGNKLGLI